MEGVVVVFSGLAVEGVVVIFSGLAVEGVVVILSAVLGDCTSVVEAVMRRHINKM